MEIPVDFFKHEGKRYTVFLRRFGKNFDVICRKENKFILSTKNADFFYGEEKTIKRMLGKLIFNRFPLKEEWYPEIVELVPEMVTFLKTANGKTVAMIESLKLKLALRENVMDQFWKDFDEELKRTYVDFISKVRERSLP